MEKNYFLTSEKLPKYGMDVLVWYPPAEHWVIGFLCKPDYEEHGAYFRNYSFGAWYIKRGVTAWIPLPKKPRLRGA